MLIQFVLIFAALMIVGYAAKGTFEGAKERVRKREWWRLWVGGIALVIMVACILAID